MTPGEKAAYIVAQAAAVHAMVAGMEQANRLAEKQRLPPVYHQSDFVALIDEFGIGHNAVMSLFRM